MRLRRGSGRLQMPVHNRWFIQVAIAPRPAYALRSPVVVTRPPNLRYQCTTAMDTVISQQSPDKIQVLLHRQYHTPDTLSPSTVSPSPLDQFRTWFTEAVQDGTVHEPEAMSLSTATPSGIPSARMVLFKQLDSRGFVFFTNYTSRKSQELLANPHAALVFYWREVHRSIRVLGTVEKINRHESEEYYKSRPVSSRLGAWASRQSTVVGEGEVHARLERLEERFGVHDGDQDNDIPVPDFWGGWRVVPRCVPFSISVYAKMD